MADIKGVDDGDCLRLTSLAFTTAIRFRGLSMPIEYSLSFITEKIHLYVPASKLFSRHYCEKSRPTDYIAIGTD